MEIIDSNYEFLLDIKCSVDPEIIFPGCDVVIMLGGYPRLPGMERKDLTLKNAENIISQASYLNKYGSANTKVL
jgi:malate/lactate dehydrogenase